MAAALLCKHKDTKKVGSHCCVQQWSRKLQFEVLEVAAVDNGTTTLMD